MCVKQRMDDSLFRCSFLFCCFSRFGFSYSLSRSLASPTAAVVWGPSNEALRNVRFARSERTYAAATAAWAGEVEESEKERK